MENKKLISALQDVLADTYTLYLKTQNYHWHVKGPNFSSLHMLFEGQYQDLADAVDVLAERILTLEAKAPATFKEFLSLTKIKEGHSGTLANDMVIELTEDQDIVLKSLRHAIEAAQAIEDEGSIAVLSERIAVHEKAHWMLASSQEL